VNWGILVIGSSGSFDLALPNVRNRRGDCRDPDGRRTVTTAGEQGGVDRIGPADLGQT